MALLRDHGEGGNRRGRLLRGGYSGRHGCAHAGFGPVRVSQSTGSLAGAAQARGLNCLVDRDLCSVFVRVQAHLDGYRAARSRPRTRQVLRQFLAVVATRGSAPCRAVLSDYANRAATLRERMTTSPPSRRSCRPRPRSSRTPAQPQDAGRSEPPSPLGHLPLQPAQKGRRSRNCVSVRRRRGATCTDGRGPVSTRPPSGAPNPRRPTTWQALPVTQPLEPWARRRLRSRNITYVQIGFEP